MQTGKVSCNNRDKLPDHHSFNSNRSRQTKTDSQITTVLAVTEADRDSQISTILTVTEADRQRFLEQQRQPARSPQERAGEGDPVVPRPPSRGGAASERGRGVARRRRPGWPQASGERSICRRTDGAWEDAGESDVTCGPPSD